MKLLYKSFLVFSVEPAAEEKDGEDDESAERVDPEVDHQVFQREFVIRPTSLLQDRYDLVLLILVDLNCHSKPYTFVYQSIDGLLIKLFRKFNQSIYQII